VYLGARIKPEYKQAILEELRDVNVRIYEHEWTRLKKLEVTLKQQARRVADAARMNPPPAPMRAWTALPRSPNSKP